MFRKEGALRTDRDNRRLAAYLALIAGLVNSAGFVIIGSFTSHVTGNVGRFADELALGHIAPALAAATMIASFFFGAFVTSMVIESHVFGSMSRASAALLSSEAVLVASFIAGTGHPASRSSLSIGAQGALLSIAMGLQNGLVTRLSGAVVRTTHLTGVVTDLGIEGARWVRYWRFRGRRGTGEAADFEKPPVPKVALLATIFGWFFAGSACGALLAVELGRFALLPVVVILLAGAVYSLASGRSVATKRES